MNYKTLPALELLEGLSARLAYQLSSGNMENPAALLAITQAAIKLLKEEAQQ